MHTTPLFPIYDKYNARLIDFHGWSLPVQFQSIIDEHLTVRNQVGIFDVSHMGELLVEGTDATSFLDFMLTNQITSLNSGFIRYSPLCNETGGTVDDLLVYCLSPTQYLLVVNAANIQTDFEWLLEQSSHFRVSIKNISLETAQIAVQGPNALALLQKLTQTALVDLKYYQFYSEVLLSNYTVLISRTGYTGEDGFEIYLNPDESIALWELLINIGEPFGLKPIGLGARDTLRLEAGLPLYGFELNPTISPIEAGLARFVSLSKANFIGKSALMAIATNQTRRLIGLELEPRAIPRALARVIWKDQPLGYVTSGSFAPYLKKNIALALVSKLNLLLDNLVEVEIRNKLYPARITPIPFYHRQKGSPK